MGFNYIPVTVYKSWYTKDDVKAKDPRVDWKNTTAKLQLNLDELKLNIL